jgi:cytochrome c oxidase subunit 2
MVVLMARRLLAVVVLLLVAASAPDAWRRSQGAPASPRVIEVTAERFEFWPSEIRIRANETVELRVRSADTVHGFRIDGAGVNLIVPKRGKGDAVVTLSDTPVGRHTIECSRMCGAGHHFMRATLVVEPAHGNSP